MSRVRQRIEDDDETYETGTTPEAMSAANAAAREAARVAHNARTMARTDRLVFAPEPVGSPNIPMGIGELVMGLGPRGRTYQQVSAARVAPLPELPEDELRTYRRTLSQQARRVRSATGLFDSQYFQLYPGRTIAMGQTVQAPAAMQYNTWPYAGAHAPPVNEAGTITSDEQAQVMWGMVLPDPSIFPREHHQPAEWVVAAMDVRDGRTSSEWWLDYADRLGYGNTQGAELFNVDLYTTRFAELARHRNEISRYPTVPVEWTVLPPGTATRARRLYQFGVLSVGQMNEVEAAYSVNPFTPIDTTDADRSVSGQPVNAGMSVHTYASVFGPLERMRQDYIAAVNKTLVAALMEQCVLYGPVMPVDPQSLSSVHSNGINTLFYRLWACGTPGLLHKDMYSHTQVQRGTDGPGGDELGNEEEDVWYRQRTIAVIRQNWETQRVFCVRKLMDIYARQMRRIADATPPIAIPWTGPALKLSPKARTLYMALLPINWMDVLHRNLLMLRGHLSQYHYTPCASYCREEPEALVFDTQGPWAAPTAPQPSVPTWEMRRTQAQCAVISTEEICQLLSLQAAATAYGQHPMGDRGGFDVFFARLFGRHVLDVARKYKPFMPGVAVGTEGAAVDTGDKIDTVMEIPQPDLDLDFVEALREVLALLTLHSDPRDTYSAAMYRLLFNGPTQLTAGAIHAMMF